MSMHRGAPPWVSFKKALGFWWKRVATVFLIIVQSAVGSLSHVMISWMVVLLMAEIPNHHPPGMFWKPWKIMRETTFTSTGGRWISEQQYFKNSLKVDGMGRSVEERIDKKVSGDVSTTFVEKRSSFYAKWPSHFRWKWIRMIIQNSMA